MAQQLRIHCDHCYGAGSIPGLETSAWAWTKNSKLKKKNPWHSELRIQLQEFLSWLSG